MGKRTKEGAYCVRAAGSTDAGCARQRNEDALLADAGSGLFIVADGVGGHARGDVASRMVVDLLPQIINRRIGEMPSPGASDDPAIGAMLVESISELSQRIHAGSKDRVEFKDMGATAVVALLTSRHAHIAHMGDSRAYLLRDGDLRQLTDDHSLVALLMHHGEITPQEAEDHPAKGRLTRFMGMEAEVDPDVQTIALKPGDRLLLCTDGLWGALPREDLARILAERNDPEATCRDLIAAGKAVGGQDNLTAVAVDAFASEVREGSILYHEYPPPRRLRKVMKAAFAKELIDAGVMHMSNLRAFHQETAGPRSDDKEGVLEYAIKGSCFAVNSGNSVHAWCATTDNDPQSLFNRWSEYDTVVEIADCEELFRRAKNACARQEVDWCELRAGYARYDRCKALAAWPQWGHGHVQKGSGYTEQKEYRFVMVLNLGAEYRSAIDLQLGDCRDIVKVIATRSGHA